MSDTTVPEPLEAKKFQCEICKKIYRKKYFLLDHARKVHGGKIIELFIRIFSLRFYKKLTFSRYNLQMVRLRRMWQEIWFVNFLQKTQTRPTFRKIHLWNVFGSLLQRNHLQEALHKISRKEKPKMRPLWKELFQNGVSKKPHQPHSPSETIRMRIVRQTFFKQ